ncbi:MAG TPA: histidine phosphatase family protein [Cytophagaceae bacterium]|jgi:phosphohistidine phosphatase|nr:histidine phosphatase family protein [Cytophagaceae bacterium]
MTKTLIFMRHAKSDWSVSGEKDFDRTLNNRGLSDAPRMGRRLFEMGVKPDLIISSPAIRAKMTAESVAEQLNYDIDNIVYESEIYESSVRTLLRVINNLDDQYNCIIIFGHNPTHTYLAEYLTKEAIGNIPTAGAVKIDFDLDSWKLVSEATGKMKWFEYPKKQD